MARRKGRLITDRELGGLLRRELLAAEARGDRRVFIGLPDAVRGERVRTVLVRDQRHPPPDAVSACYIGFEWLGPVGD